MRLLLSVTPPRPAFLPPVCSARSRPPSVHATSSRPRHPRSMRSKPRSRPSTKRTRNAPPPPRPSSTTSTREWASPPPPSPVRRAAKLRPDSCPALVLNADFSPLSYMPLSLWPWQDVVKAVFLDRVTVVATYDVGVRSPGMLFPLPSVISLKRYQPVSVRRPAFTRFNVFLRDAFACQYCGLRCPTHELTFDHVVPRCKSGKTNWENVVTACIACNHRKGRFLLPELDGMHLRRLPRQPTHAELQASAKKFPPQYLHESWRDYVYWSHSMHVEEAD